MTAMQWIVIAFIVLIGLAFLATFISSEMPKRQVRGRSGKMSLFGVIPSVSGNPVATATVAAAAATTASQAKQKSCCEGDAHGDTRGDECRDKEKHECGCDHSTPDKKNEPQPKRPSSHSRYAEL